MKNLTIRRIKNSKSQKEGQQDVYESYTIFKNTPYAINILNSTNP